MAKKGKKGKKGKNKEENVPPITTQYHLSERTKCLQPRFGDAILKTMRTEECLDEVPLSLLIKSASRKVASLNLSSLRIRALPDIIYLIPELQHLRDINLSKNQLFNAEVVFQILSQLGGLRILNVSNNFINGTE